MKSISIDDIREHYDRLSPLYARFWGEHIHHGYWRNGETPEQAQQLLIERLVAHAGIPRSARVLDVGCGLGGSALWLARQWGCEVLGITISSVQAELARKRARAAQLEARVRFEVQDANRLVPASEPFDVVWCVECTEHLYDKADFVRRCARVLRPGGRLALAAWLASADSAEHRDLVERIGAGMLCPSFAGANDYTTWLRASGFVDVCSEDVSAHVAKTWMHAELILGRPEVKLILRAADRATRDFAATIPWMADAFAVGAMRYGFFAARKPSP
jgi:tocopherol O-methyltransferase